ncbi:GNAT family N-acetyltransferase [Microbulbifer sp. JMSA004]|uniref:GNAT family N-acetyltransferase n=1 Tax=unclassified Microbulbifer TaxID=2619833 RepID=UPI0024AE1AEF|nr:GNAT family N-acetyltransferase [Microbulbifer sp. VAAF005]WHI45812.1 GNAT family N-acetyltransferase [Microbulbifer sp. VAAF005]
MSDIKAKAELEVMQQGALPDGRRWTLDGEGYQCQLDSNTFFTLLNVNNGSNAQIQIPHDEAESSKLNGWLEWLFDIHGGVAIVELVSLNGDKIKEIFKSDFYQQTEIWYRGNNGGTFPLRWVENDQGVKHPFRAEPVKGEVYRRHFHTLGMDLSLRHLDPDKDLELFTSWMNVGRVAKFWEEEGDLEKQKKFIREVIQDPHKYPLIASFDDVPFAYFEVYWALEDRIAPYYDCHSFDRGAHMLVGNSRFLGRRYALAWLKGVSHFMFLDDSRTQTLVGEPRADNGPLLKYMNGTFGWKKVKEFDFPHKRAALISCDRADFFEGAGKV